MSKNFLIFSILVSFSFCINYKNLFEEANSLYLDQNYKKSIELYELIIENGKENSAVFYNLGNSYYRLQDIGQSIWAYKNAIRLNPRDKDLAHNLKVAEANKIDRIKSPPLFILHEYYRKIKSTFTIFESALIGGILLFVFALVWIKQSFSEKKSEVLKNIFQILLVLIIIVHIFIVDMIFEKSKISKEAIIVEKFEALSGPFFGNNKVLFQINEGSVVELLQEKSNWSEIILIDGKKGWVLSSVLRKMK